MLEIDDSQKPGLHRKCEDEKTKNIRLWKNCIAPNVCFQKFQMEKWQNRQLRHQVNPMPYSPKSKKFVLSKKMRL